MPEQTHTLDELVRLYSRPAFIIWITLLSASLVVLLSTAHITEWAFERQCLRDDPALPTTSRPANMWRRRSRKDSAPLLSHSHSAPAGTHGSPRRYGALDETTIAHGSTPSVDGPPEMASNNLWKQPGASDDAEAALPDEARSKLSDAAIGRTRVILGVAYGSASGTLSGLCLLFAKTGVELLILTIVGQNQVGGVAEKCLRFCSLRSFPVRPLSSVAHSACSSGRRCAAGQSRTSPVDATSC